MKRTHLLNRSSVIVLAAFAGLTLAACNPATQTPAASVQQAPAPTAALALSTDPVAPPLTDAPAVNNLPPAPRARIGHLQRPQDGYAFVDRGYAMSDAFNDAPPDYTFDYGGVRPWVWRADDQSEQVVEPVPGGDRYYYYRPGDDQPFLIRDPDYSYGYENGELVVVYDRNGRALSDQYAEERADAAGRYLARARAIYAATQNAQHQAVAAANWRARQTYLDNERNQWAAEQNQDSDWRAYRAEHDQDQAESQWEAERYRREAEAARYATQANDAQAAARFAQAAVLALQLSQGHRQGPPPSQGAPQGGAGFASPSQGQPHGANPPPPAQVQAQGPVTATTPVHAPAPNAGFQNSPPVQGQRPSGPDHVPHAQPGPDPHAQARAAQAQQAAAAAQQQAARAQAQQQAVQRQQAADVARQAAAQQQATRVQAQQQARRQQAADAAARANEATQAAAQQAAAQQQSAHAQAQQQSAQRQQAMEAARAQGAQQAAMRQQALAQKAHAAAAAKPTPAAKGDKRDKPDDPNHPRGASPN